VSKIELVDLVDDRVKLVRIESGSSVLHLAQCHLTAGPEYGNKRIEEINKLSSFLNKTMDNVYICGDFNEDLIPEKGILKLLIDKSFTVQEEERKRLMICTCDKMRSAVQYQINKMRYPDKSTKDAFFGLDKRIDKYEIL